MDNGSGWVKTHRKIDEWEWYTDANTFRVFFHLIIKANHKDRKYKGIIVKAGTLLTGQDLLGQQLGLSRRKIRTALENLKATNEIAIKSSPKGSVIQIVKYLDYQLTTKEAAIKRPTDDQQTTTNKNVNNEKKENIYREFKHLKLTEVEFDKLKENYTKEQIDEMLDDIENYKLNKNYTSLLITCRNWLKRKYPTQAPMQKEKPTNTKSLIERLKL